MSQHPSASFWLRRLRLGPLVRLSSAVPSGRSGSVVPVQRLLSGTRAWPRWSGGSGANAFDDNPDSGVVSPGVTSPGFLFLVWRRRAPLLRSESQIRVTPTLRSSLAVPEVFTGARNKSAVDDDSNRIRSVGEDRAQWPRQAHGSLYMTPPQVRPAPSPMNMTLCPDFNISFSISSSSAMGIVAAVVFPYCWMLL